MQNLFLKPARDAAGNPVLVRDPQTLQPLDPDGEWKEGTAYWHRRVRDRDVIDATITDITVQAAPAAICSNCMPHPHGGFICAGGDACGAARVEAPATPA